MSRREEVLDVAQALVESEGVDSLAMRRVAAAMGVRAPSLYKHVSGLAEVEAGLQARALAALADALSPARGDLDAVGRAYRAWALAHPGLYALATSRPLHRDALPEGLEVAAALPVVELAGGDEHRARALWSLAHGLVVLELAGRFPPGADLDATWRAALAPWR